MLILSRIVSIVVALTWLIVSAWEGSAESLPPFKIVANGTQYEITLGTEHMGLERISVYFESPGSVSNAVAFEVEGPAGVRGTVSAALVPRGAAVDSTILLSGEDLKVLGPKGKGYDAFLLDSPDGGVVRGLYHLHKDACLPNKSTRYLSQLTLDLSGVDRGLYANRFVVRVAMQEAPFLGSRVASIKPASDGKYRGEPILLMGTISYGGEYVNITKRVGKRVRSRKRIPVVKYVSYKGRALSLARLRGVLRGGKATVELSNGGYIYGVCFNLVRKRQVRNGYPL